MDKLRDLKNSLRNFVAFLREQKSLPVDDAAAEVTIEVFLGQQFPGLVREFPVCVHCGSEDLVEGDFKDELLMDSETGTWTKPADPKSAGPAWVCRAKDCGTYTSREV